MALTPVVTVATAAVAGSLTMFLSSDQLGVVVLAAIIAGVAGVPVATVMARSQLRYQQLTESQAARAGDRGEPSRAGRGRDA